VATVVPSIARDWEPAVMRMLENYSISWGGIGNVLIPVDETGSMHKAFWPLVEIFDADLWAGYTSTYRGFQLSNPDGFRQWMDREARKVTRKHGGGIAKAREMLTRDHVMTHPASPWPPPVALADAIRRRTSPAIEHERLNFSMYRADGPPGHRIVDVRDLEPLPKRIRVLDTHRLPTSVQLAVATRCGGLAPSHMKSLVDAGVTVEVVPVEDSDLGVVLRYAWFGPPSGPFRYLGRDSSRPKAAFEEDEFLQTTPLAGLSAIGSTQMWRWAPDQEELPVVVVVGSHADDFCYALALDRCGIPTVWLPEEFATGDNEVSEQVRQALAIGVHAGPRDWDDRRKVLRSLSMSTSRLVDVATRIKSASWLSELELEVVEEISLPPYRLSVILDPGCYDDPLEEPFIGDAMARTVPAAIPSAVRSDDPWKLTWWSEVNDPQRPLPSRSALNGLVVADNESWRATARCGRDGISYFSHTMGLVLAGATLQQMSERPRLRFPTAQAVFERLFTGAGFSVQESPAGKFRRLTTELWGDLASLAADLSNPERFALLRGWLSTSRSGADPGVFTGGRRRYLSLTDVMLVSGLASEDARLVLDGYLTRGIVRRGLVLKCGHCLHFEWYDLEEIGQSFSCRRCRASTVLTIKTWRMGAEPTYYYDLAEVVFQALQGNVEVPVRALASLQRDARSFAETPEVELVDVSGAKIEIDLLAIADGRIIVGEAKTGDKLQDTAKAESAWLGRIERLASAVVADEVIFATAAPAWRPPTLARINLAFRDAEPTTIRILEGC